jgi:hypothetical protein
VDNITRAVLQINKAQDAQGFRSLPEDSLGDYVAMMFMPGFSPAPGSSP